MKLKEIINWIKWLLGIKPKGKKKLDEPFNIKKVKWLSGAKSLHTWPITIKLLEFRDNASWSVEGVVPHWSPRRMNGTDCVGTIMFFFKHNDKVYGQPTEWFEYGQINQAMEIFRSERDGKQPWDEPFKYQTKYPDWVCLCGRNWGGQVGTQERSNIVPLNRV